MVTKDNLRSLAPYLIPQELGWLLYVNTLDNFTKPKGKDKTWDMFRKVDNKEYTK